MPFHFSSTTVFTVDCIKSLGWLHTPFLKHLSSSLGVIFGQLSAFPHVVLRLLSHYLCAHNNRLPLLAELRVMVTTLLYLGTCIRFLKHLSVAVSSLLGTSILFSSS
jgi:hypothetical protein